MRGYKLDNIYFEHGITGQKVDLIFIGAHYNDDENMILEGEQIKYHYIVPVDVVITKFDLVPAIDMLRWVSKNYRQVC